MWFFEKKKRIGLALGSGGARGLAHIGVLKSLFENKIPIDMIAGASSGALVGAFFAHSGGTETIEKMVEEVTYKRLAEVLVDPAWLGGLLKGDKTLKFLRECFGDTVIEDLKTPFRAVATDLASAESVIFDKGNLAEALRASISVPLVYAPVESKGRVLVDGGVSCPVPVEVVREMGADVVIAVNLDSVYFSEKKKRNYMNSTVEVLKNSYFALRYNLAKKEVWGADVVIEPVMKYVADFDFVQGKKAVEAGYLATKSVIKKIEKLL